MVQIGLEKMTKKMFSIGLSNLDNSSSKDLTYIVKVK